MNRNAFQRYHAVFEGRPVDYVPRIPILMHFAADFIGSDYAAFASDYRILVQAQIACARFFGIDQLSCISDPYRETSAFGGIIEYRSDAPPRCTHPLEHSTDLSVLPEPDPFVSERMQRPHLCAWLGRRTCCRGSGLAQSGHFFDGCHPGSGLCRRGVGSVCCSRNSFRRGADRRGCGYNRYRRCHYQPGITGYL